MKIAVFLPNWIGDAVMATPAIMALRRHFGDAQMIAVAKPYVMGVIEGTDWFQETIPAYNRSWKQSTVSVAWQLRRRGIDLAILFPNSFRSAMTARLGGCRRRVGYVREGRGWLLTDALPMLRDAQGKRKPSPVIDAYNRLAQQVGCPWPGHRMVLETTDEDETAADTVWLQTGLSKHREVICINPGAAFGAAKYWPWQHFARLAQRITDERGCAALVLCGPAERDMANRIVRAANRKNVHALAPFPLSIGLTKACIRRCSLLITTDSGPRHFGTAFQRPVLSLFGPTHIAWTETYHPLGFHLQKEMHCGPCQQRTCPLGHHNCMRELKPDEVHQTATRLLQIAKQSTGGFRYSA